MSFEGALTSSYASPPKWVFEVDIAIALEAKSFFCLLQTLCEIIVNFLNMT